MCVDVDKGSLESKTPLCGRVEILTFPTNGLQKGKKRTFKKLG